MTQLKKVILRRCALSTAKSRTPGLDGAGDARDFVRCLCPSIDTARRLRCEQASATRPNLTIGNGMYSIACNVKNPPLATNVKVRQRSPTRCRIQNPGRCDVRPIAILCSASLRTRSPTRLSARKRLCQRTWPKAPQAYFEICVTEASTKKNKTTYARF